MATITTADFRNGLCLEFNNDYFQIVEFQHVKPGKGAAFVRTRLKSMTTGKVLDNTFPSGHKVESARIERRPFQFLYTDGEHFHFMNNETFEQVAMEEKLINNPGLLKEGQEVEVVYHAEKDLILGCELPQFVSLLITYSEPGIKGDTATNASKPATLETGATINVPLFVNEGEKIKIDTRSNSYVERVKD
ncbi:MAG: elongation factor P [Chitinophagales bacterium]|nr:elongation factor P [Bacteroidota bacterium]MCB9042360.1 elongation factor P [Chitinophagales bacterium]